ncbi:MAG: hypothetical protein HUU50_19840 [Candidatus Brocadiae bacterium]|nr:hypothetical protein [Candidatus Brocadiia bacterium]
MKKYILSILCLLFFLMYVSAQDAQEHFLKAKMLLQQSNFSDALKCLEKASNMDRSNQEYKREYMLLRQVIKVRKYLPKEPDQERWSSMAFSLYTYYMQNKAYIEMIEIAKEIHGRVSNSDSFLLVAESFLIAQQNKEVVAWISQVTPPGPFLQVLYAIAVARMGEIEEGKKIYWELAKKEQKNSFYFFYKASLEALIGYKETSLKTLLVCFQNTAPKQLTMIKARVQESKDFAELAPEKSFQEVMQTKSLIPESSCSEGKDCSSCPQRGKCGGE